jgi:WD40-like Beta Propeller Repeat
MPATRKRRRLRRGGDAIALTLVAAALWSPQAIAAGPPLLGKAWASAVFSSTARLHAEINPNELFSTYHFDYITKAAYDANIAASKDGFAGASRIPVSSDANIGSGKSAVAVLQPLSKLSPDTAYRYRVVAKNSAGTVNGPHQAFVTFPGSSALLPDNRGWEMVSPVGKNGGRVEEPGQLAGGGVLQAAAQGGAITYGSATSFAGGAGAPPASQYLATRTSGGWSTENITVPLFSGTYDTKDQGVPYRLFSGDLSRGLLLSGRSCRGEAGECPVANPPLAGTDAPVGWQNHYLRQGGGFEALLGPTDVLATAVGPNRFEASFAGASLDLQSVVLSSCAALTANTTEFPDGEGCDAAQPNLYLWKAGSIGLVNLLPSETTGTPGAELAAQSGAISSDGSRIYWTDLATGNLYLRTGGQTKQVDATAGGGGVFETASGDGSVAYFTKGGHLWRYLAAGGTATDLTPAGEVAGVLGASADGSHVYFQDGAGLKLWKGGTTTTVAPGANATDSSNWPATIGTSRVSADGTKLLFVSTESLTGYDNTDLDTKALDSQVFLYDSAGAGVLRCISCNPSLGRPIGPSSIPGSFPNGTAAGSPNSYKPRALSANGNRAYFASGDALVLTDINDDTDVYQWQAQGSGSCTRVGGCVNLISSGLAEGGASFVDASANGSDAFFLTDGSLVGADPGAVDLYDARVGGGFSEPTKPIPCQGDACQVLPPEPIEPTLTTLLSGPGNPAVRYAKETKRCRKGFLRRKGKCVKERQRNAQRQKRRRGR